MSKKAKLVMIVGSSLLVCIVVALVMFSYHKNHGLGARRQAQSGGMLQPTTPTWTFAVSGDSRNCGDVVVPTIAADAATHAPRFYWHLGDFRFIALVDEDMQCRVAAEPQPAESRPADREMRGWRDFQEVLAIDRPKARKVKEWLSYERHAWRDFEEYQLGAFDQHHIPVFLGIGNHEMILHNDHEDFIATFKNRMNPDAQKLESGNIRTYYHWTIGGVDFINLDNAGTALREKDLSFGDKQFEWLQNRLAKDAASGDVKAVVVGMHAALPDSISSSHSMNESKEGTESGREVYQALWRWQNQTPKHLYLLASHSHYYMEGIFNTPAWNSKGEILQGWIVGTAGAHRNPLPTEPTGWKNAKDARTNVYGYLLGTVNPDGQSDGSIRFEFREVKMDAVPADVAARFHRGFVAWCFQRNTDCGDADEQCEKPVHANYGYSDYVAAIAPMHCRQ